MAGELVPMAAGKVAALAVKNPQVSAVGAGVIGVIGFVGLAGYAIYKLSPAISEKIRNSKSVDLEVSKSAFRFKADG